MDYEEKYKNALERASKLSVQNPFDTVSQMMEHVFPELKESEDTRIRKELIEFVKSRGGFKQEYIAWLESQCEKPQGKSALDAIKEEKVDNANKVEPKFNLGDWITNGHCTRQITFIDSRYWCSETYVLGNFIDIDKTFHLWTIADAKDGDVLVTTFDEDNMIVMYHSMCTTDTINVHCCLDNKFVCWNIGVFDAEDVKPATKEQRDLLFQKMHEAGYEWDSEKKEVKEIKIKGMTDTQYLDKALDFIVEREHDGDYICCALHDIPEEYEICSEDCLNLCRNCVLRFLKNYKKGGEE